MGDGKVRETAAAGVGGFKKAIGLEFEGGTTLRLVFQDGQVRRYDVARLFEKYPQLHALEERELFTSGRLLGSSGVVWNDGLDVDAQTVYWEGESVKDAKLPAALAAGCAVFRARTAAGLSQAELSAATGIDQSDISKIERGAANPSVGTLERIAKALGNDLKVVMV